jgi:uncharacterized ParB-like nuclease family protein
MSTSSSELYRWVALALVGATGLGCRSAYECSGVEERQAKPAWGDFQVLVRGTPVDGWLTGVALQESSAGTYEVYVLACVRPVSSVDDFWRLNTLTVLRGRVETTPVSLRVPSQAAPGLSGTVVNVLDGIEYNFATGGSGRVTVRSFDPQARRFALEGEVSTVQSNRLQLRWDLSW